MTLADHSTAAAAVEATLASGDFSGAGAALMQYLEPLRAGQASLAEIARARELIDRGLHATLERRAVLARDLARLRQLQGGYGSAVSANTWVMSG